MQSTTKQRNLLACVEIGLAERRYRAGTGERRIRINKPGCSREEDNPQTEKRRSFLDNPFRDARRRQDRVPRFRTTVTPLKDTVEIEPG